VKPQLSRQQILALFEALDDALASDQVRGEIYLLGGAVMCLVHQARPTTQDVDALLLPSVQLRQAAKRVALIHDLSDDWLNDAAKGFLSENSDSAPYLELSHLTVLTATPEYLLAMKCLALRLGAEFSDEQDVRFLLRYLNITRYETALEIIQRFYPLQRFPQKTLYALQELLPES
jgi:hypothetical protein